jgi:hypothetical protein
VLAAVLVDPSATDGSDPAADAIAAWALSLDSVITERHAGLTPAETALLREWLRRLAGRP